MATIQATEERHNRIREAVRQSNAAWNEEIWNYVVADVLARGKQAPLQQLFGDYPHLQPSDSWVEAMPIPPRFDEGNSRIDIACEAIRRRVDTAGGIEFGGTTTGAWVGFAEAKVLSDCSVDVAHDAMRNQLARVIENLLSFQSDDGIPDHLHFAILTPRKLRERKHRRSRLYGYKFDDYERDKGLLIDDIKLSPLMPRHERGWTYRAVDERVEHLRLHWAAYEDILDCDPELSEIDVMRSALDGHLPARIRHRLDEILRVAR